MADLAALHDLAEVGGLPLLQEVELADVLGRLPQGPGDAVNPHLRYQHPLHSSTQLYFDCGM